MKKLIMALFIIVSFTTQAHQVGKLFFKGAKGTAFCTATVINNKQLLTAAHCAAGVKPQNMVFVLGNKFFKIKAHLTGFSNMPKKWNTKAMKKDYAILTLVESINNLPSLFADLNPNAPVTIYRYLTSEYNNKTFTPPHKITCTVSKSFKKLFTLKNCDIFHGTSGASIWQNGKIVGTVSSGAFNDKGESIEVIGLHIRTTITDLGNSFIQSKIFFSKGA